MTAAEVGPMLNDQHGKICYSVDYDNDRHQELSVVRFPAGWASETNVTWRCQSDGTFVQTSPVGIPDSATWRSWGDYNNDGWLDAFCSVNVQNALPQPMLFRNLGGDGFTGFTNVTAALNVTASPNGILIPAWGDFDNDGWLDVFFTGYYSSLNGLFHNNRDGTFTQILDGSPVYDVGRLVAPSWIDYNNDGFLDLFIAAGDGSPERNLLYRNNGNANHWLKVKLVGRASNRSGIGAKVRVKATINRRTFCQMREITCENALAGQNGLLAQFGLGDADYVTTLRIEWPSGIIQELHKVPANHSLIVEETQNYGEDMRPCFSCATKDSGGLQLAFTEPRAGFCYILEGSNDLVHWTKLMVRPSAEGVVQFLDRGATNYSRRYYRIQVP